MEEKFYFATIEFSDGSTQEISIQTYPEFVMSEIEDLAAGNEADIVGVIIVEEVPV
jgi:hypothetical protein